MLTLPAVVEDVDEDLLESAEEATFSKSLWLALRLDRLEGVPPMFAPDPPPLRGRRNRPDVEDYVPVCGF